MNTDDLIHMLAKNAGPAPSRVTPRLLGLYGAFGWALAAVVSILVLGMIPQTHAAYPGVWFKFIYAFMAASTAAWVLFSLGKPGVNPRTKLITLGLIGFLVGLLGTGAWLNTPAELRVQAVMGHSWIICPWIIAGLSLPILWLSFSAMMHMAPTRLRLTGAVCGLFSGALAAGGYAFACTETTLPFVAVWYSLGILISGLIGAILGPRFLNW